MHGTQPTRRWHVCLLVTRRFTYFLVPSGTGIVRVPAAHISMGTLLRFHGGSVSVMASQRGMALRPPPSLPTVAAQKPSGTRSIGTKKGSITFPVGEPYTGPQQANSNSAPVKLLSRVQELRLLSKAEKAGLLSAAEKFGLSLSTVEKLGLLSKAEELGVLSAATDSGTPAALLILSLGLLLLGPLCVFFIPEENALEIAVQVFVALVSIIGGSAAFAASNFVSNLQKSD